MESSSERIKCVNGCGNLTNEKHEKLSVRDRIKTVFIGFLFIICGFLSVQSLGVVGEFVFVTGLSFVIKGLFGGNDTAFFLCKKCGGGLIDSKTLIKKIGEEKALAIENSLKGSEFGGKKCPTCEEKMKILDLEYKVHAISWLLPKTTKNIELDGCINCSNIWFDRDELSKLDNGSTTGGIIVDGSLKLIQNPVKSPGELSDEHRKVGSKCSELECKGTVMYKSKFCYKHRKIE
jgi:Zn-finger nucleic acid-binding protein/nitrate reductase NapE component